MCGVVIAPGLANLCSLQRGVEGADATATIATHRPPADCAPLLGGPVRSTQRKPLNMSRRNNKAMKKERRVVLSLIVLCGLSLVLSWCVPASAQRTSGRPAVLTNSVANDPIAFDVSPPLRSLPLQGTALQGTRLMPAPQRPKLQHLKAAAASQGTVAAGGAVPSSPGPAVSASVGLSFDGISGDPGSPATENCPLVSGVQLAPPDTNLAVGDTQVVQWVNICYSVYDKATGSLIAGPFPGNHFWAGFSTSVCSFQNAGDIIIQWDKANHRWMASQNVFGPYLTCVAVSTSADATGSYNRYQFVQPGFPDYPKWGLTPNVYYQTQNDFGYNDGFKGVNVCAYDAAAMRAGKKAKQICILDTSNGTLFDDSMLPADNDYAASSSGTQPEVLLGSIDNFFPGGTAVYEYLFTVNFKKGTATLSGANGTMPISVPLYALACGGFGACIQQPSPGS